MMELKEIVEVVSKAVVNKQRARRRSVAVYPPKLNPVQRVEVVLLNGARCCGYLASGRCVVLAGEYRNEADARGLAARFQADSHYFRVALALGFEGIGRVEGIEKFSTAPVDNRVSNPKWAGVDRAVAREIC